MTTSTITWHKPDNLPDAQTNVLIALNVDGIRTSCEGFIDSSPHAPSTDADGAPNDDGMQWYDVTAEPLDHRHVVAWAEMPEGPAAIAALREALNAPEPEPVARCILDNGDEMGSVEWLVRPRSIRLDHGSLLYAAPPAAPEPSVDDMPGMWEPSDTFGGEADSAAPPAAPADDHATPSGGQEAGPQEDRIEAAYWRFDARHKGYSQWKTAPMSERDAFKAEMRNALEAEKVRAEMRLVARGWRRPDAPAAPASQWTPIETAPKDGALFLCWVDAVRCGETDEGQQYEEDVSQLDFCYWRTQSDTPDGGWFDPCCGQIGDRQRVTHWMPLPAAPDHLRDVAEKAAPAAPVPDGWVMVPKEATREMCVAAVVLNNGNAVYKNVAAEALEIEEQIYGEVWSAMIAASPAAPVLPLTDSELAKIAMEDEFLLYCDQDSFNEIARAIEAAHGITGGNHG